MATIAKEVSDGKTQEEPPARAHALHQEFKLEAVRLLQLGQKPATELALELGTRRNQLYKWAEELSRKDGDEAEPSMAHAVDRPLISSPR